MSGSDGEEVSDEAVDHPAHYGGDTVYEAIKVIEAWGLDFHLGNTVKYVSRAGKKDPSATLEDLRKARWYLDRAIARLTAQDELNVAQCKHCGDTIRLGMGGWIGEVNGIICPPRSPSGAEHVPRTSDA